MQVRVMREVLVVGTDYSMKVALVNKQGILQGNNFLWQGQQG